MFILLLFDELKFLKVIWFVFDELFCGLFISVLLLYYIENRLIGNV